MTAVFFVTVVIASTIQIIGRAMSSSQDSVRRVEAINLAREGMEAIYQLRATNWLRFSGERRETGTSYGKSLMVLFSKPPNQLLLPIGRRLLGGGKFT